MIWKPWADHKFDIHVLDIPISEPPCKHCALFKPRFDFKEGGKPDGVRLCHAEKMYNDFSCYSTHDGNEFEE